MFTGVKQELLSDVIEMEISDQTKKIVASRYEGYSAIQNLEFRNKEDQLIGKTEI